MSALLVNADDFGLHASVNSAIETCIDFGSVNSVSVIVNGTAPDFNLLHSFIQKRIFIGIHITWVGEPWLTEPIFISDWKELAKRMFLGGKKFRFKMQQEAETQINRLIEKKIYPDHIDSHQHVHHLPGLWNITNVLKKKYAIKRIRTVHVKSNSLIRKNSSGLALNILAGLILKEDNYFFCAGIKYAGNYNTPLFNNELKVASGCNTELIVHPGDSNLLLNQSYGHWNFDWQKEFAALTNNAFISSVAENNFYLLKK